MKKIEFTESITTSYNAEKRALRELGLNAQDGEETFPGGIWEETEVTLIWNKYSTGNYCPIHGEVICQYTYKIHTWTGEERVVTDSLWRTPLVIVATNEGGHNSTGVCADCLLEKLGLSRKK